MINFMRPRSRTEDDDSDLGPSQHTSSVRKSKKKKGKGANKKDEVQRKGFISLWSASTTGSNNNTKSKKDKKTKKKKIRDDDNNDEIPNYSIRSTTNHEKKQKKVKAMARFQRFSMCTVGPGKMFNTQGVKNQGRRDDVSSEIADDADTYGNENSYEINNDRTPPNRTPDEDTRSTSGSCSSSNKPRTETVVCNVDKLLGNVVVNRRASNQTTKISNRSRQNPTFATHDRAVSEISSIADSFACDTPSLGMDKNEQGHGSPKSVRKSTAPNPASQSNTKKKMKEKSLKKRVSMVNDQWFRIFCQSKHFCNLCDTVFDTVDQDDVGAIDESELYQGLLLIHLKLGVFFGSAACRPISRQQCKVLFQKMDRDQSGVLDKIEFREVMMLFFGNILFRVMIQWITTIIVVPLIAQNVTKAFVGIISLAIGIMSICSRYTGMSPFGSHEVVDAGFIGPLRSPTSSSYLQRVGQGLDSITKFIPSRIKKRAPLIVVSTVLGTVVVPIIVYQIDSIFQKMADSRSKKAPVRFKN